MTNSLSDRVIEHLTEARDLLARKGGYVKGARSRRRANGEYAYCALGALDKVRGPVGWSLNNEKGELCDPAVLALDAAIPREIVEEMRDGRRPDEYNFSERPIDHASSRIAAYNNTTNQETVVKWFEDAIQMQKSHPMEPVK